MLQMQTKEYCGDLILGYKKDRPPDRALLVIHEGKALYLGHIGPGIDYYLSECAYSEDEYTEPNGVYVWEGRLITNLITYYEGDHDSEEWLDGTLRPATLEEWKTHLRDEYIWNREEWLESEPTEK